MLVPRVKEALLQLLPLRLGFDGPPGWWRGGHLAALAAHEARAVLLAERATDAAATGVMPNSVINHWDWQHAPCIAEDERLRLGMADGLEPPAYLVTLAGLELVARVEFEALMMVVETERLERPLSDTLRDSSSDSLTSESSRGCSASRCRAMSGDVGPT